MENGNRKNCKRSITVQNGDGIQQCPVVLICLFINRNSKLPKTEQSINAHLKINHIRIVVQGSLKLYRT